MPLIQPRQMNEQTAISSPSPALLDASIIGAVVSLPIAYYTITRKKIPPVLGVALAVSLLATTIKTAKDIENLKGYQPPCKCIR